VAQAVSGEVSDGGYALGWKVSDPVYRKQVSLPGPEVEPGPLSSVSVTAIKRPHPSGNQWLTPAILAIQEAEIRGLLYEASLGK
jgi:hypothetical protein